MKMRLRPADVLLFTPTGWGILLPLVKWLLSYGHVALYFTETKRGLLLIIESIGRGVLIRSLLSYAGRRVRVMRPKVDDDTALRIAKEAEHLADNPGSWYGYFDIPRYVLPRLIWHKLTGRRYGFAYRRNSFFICSELVASAYRRAGVALVDEKAIPLPDDISRSRILENLGEIVVPSREGPTGAERER
mgnify:CR=1 FL=1